MFGGENQTGGFVSIFGHAVDGRKEAPSWAPSWAPFFPPFIGSSVHPVSTGPEEWHSNLQLGAGQVPRSGPGEIG